MKKSYFFGVLVLSIFVFQVTAQAAGQDPYGNEDPNKKLLKEGLLGAAAGGIAAGASDGDAGKGALIGAGTNIIGGALLDALSGPKQAPPPPPGYGYQQQYQQQAPQQYQQQGYQPQAQSQQSYYNDPPVQQQSYYPPRQSYGPPPPVQPNPNQKILKSGLLGAATGGIAAGASGGKAGTGALVGAGTNIIGGALLDTLTQPSAPQQQPYYPPPPQQYYQQQQPVYAQQQQQQPAPTKKIIRKYDAEGNIIQEEEVYI